MQRKAAAWFQCKLWFWNIIFAIMANTMSEIHSWMTFSCTKENWPPFPSKPRRLAGTWQQYSKNAIPHEKSITPHSGHWEDRPLCWSFKWPYHAIVMKILLKRSSRMVEIPFISISCPCMKSRRCESVREKRELLWRSSQNMTLIRRSFAKEYSMFQLISLAIVGPCSELHDDHLPLLK